MLDFESILRPVYKEFGKLSKKSIDQHKDLPSYNTCLRKGLNLIDLNRKFKEEASNIKCKTCSKVFVPNSKGQQFCSQSCSATTTNTKRKRKKICEWCDSEINKGSSRFCSLSCFHALKQEKSYLSWKGGNNTFSNRVLKSFIAKDLGYSCSVCGISNWNEKKIVLELEHIDGNSENNSPENLCLLCPNCHSQTSTYKGRNIGNGRHSRRVRYQQGLSY